MALTYVVPDIHGRIDLLELAIAAITAHASGANAKLITLGDYVDRGPDSQAVVARLCAWRHPSLQLIALKGNHEAMMWEAAKGFLEVDRWLAKGGSATLASYNANPSNAREAFPAHHLSWISALPLFFADRYRVYVHAGLDHTLPLDQQSESTMIWKRYPARFKKAYGRRHVVHGHDGTVAAPVVESGKSNLDGLAWKTGRLIVAVYDDEHAGATKDYLEILADPASA